MAAERPDGTAGNDRGADEPPDDDLPAGDLGSTGSPGIDRTATNPTGIDLTGIDVAGYLDRLGVADPGPPSAAALHRLHTAHVERIPFETLWIALGRPRTLDPAESVDRIVAGYGGYCFLLNPAFAALLQALGYRVTLHRGGVKARPDHTDDDEHDNHVTLVVRLPGGDVLADVGLGELHAPLPLRAGPHQQGPFTYHLGPSSVIPGGWRLGNDRAAASFACMDVDPAPARIADFTAPHRRLSTDPGSPFVRVVTAQRRDVRGLDLLRGRVLTRIDGRGRRDHRLAGAAEWFDLAGSLFGLRPADLRPDERRAVWERILATEPPSRDPDDPGPAADPDPDGARPHRRRRT